MLDEHQGPKPVDRWSSSEAALHLAWTSSAKFGHNTSIAARLDG